MALAVGFNSHRGDAIVVNSMDRLVTANGSAAAISVPSATAEAPVPSRAAARDPASVTVVTWVLVLLLAAVAVAALVYMVVRNRPQPAVRQLDLAAREQMLHDVRRWIETPEAAK